jgi:hypothetical protein
VLHDAEVRNGVCGSPNVLLPIKHVANWRQTGPPDQRRCRPRTWRKADNCVGGTGLKRSGNGEPDRSNSSPQEQRRRQGINVDSSGALAAGPGAELEGVAAGIPGRRDTC